MGCISSKRAAPRSPCIEYSAALTKNGSVVLEPSLSSKKKTEQNTNNLNSCHSSELRKIGSSKKKGNGFNKKDQADQTHNVEEKDNNSKDNKPSEDHKSKELKNIKSKKEGFGKGGFSFKFGFSHRSLEAEQVAAGWPSWLSAAAGEAIYGWVPLKADAYEKLEKIGQGTYSSVFRAREVETGRILALKKVRFDNFQPESIRFMAREIMILRRLDHPNIMKLEGIITSRSSSSIYLVFEYMEHDLAGLVAANDIKFSDVQIKCYMRQLFSAVEHCHMRGIMHRDIKASNILVNNDGILKLADFGLANVVNSKSKQPLTSRVVTLWYRPPELLMGATEYGVSVDLWSVGCVLAELFLGKPILKGRTEVEQLHKIFKLCGSPPEEYWKNSKLPHATMFKPQYSYESSLKERCKEFPTTSVDLLQTLLSVEPYKRGTASSALMSEYFRTKPYACEPSKLPKYPPTKEMDAKSREDAQKKKHGPRARDTAARKPRRFRKNLQETNSAKIALKEDGQDDNSNQSSHRNNGGYPHILRPKTNLLHRESQKAAFDTVSENCEFNATQGDSTVSSAADAQSGGASGFAWAKRRNAEFSTKSVVSDGSKSQFSVLDTTFAKSAFDLSKPGNEYAKAIRKMRTFDGSELFDAEVPEYIENRVHKSVDKHVIDFSGPLLTQQSRMDEHLRRNESQIRHVARRSRFEREAEPAPSQ
ncbi:cyclin-dependent kinase C-2 C-like [Argentina anserina]|uniref:cyclin-dependent kinase C-2 C-like n=1 Tax=Argentina anserina TaxID=57926 RepID=UPI0021766C4C|nr:cyclin-dependent kinase C-2 C-like [Potentilla anserina]